MTSKSNSNKIVGFKKFSDIKKESKIEEIDPSIPITGDDELPMNPNLPKKSTKVEKTISNEKIVPGVQNDNLQDESNESKVETFGKVAKFPKNTKASKAFNFLENIKVPKKSIWYIMVEKDNELQLVKYNYKEGVDLNKFVNELKGYYLDKNKSNRSICESINKITVDGNDKYSMIKQIPNIEVDGKKIITKITEDLIKLLSK